MEEGWNRGNLYGAYVHGIFDGPGIAQELAACLCAKKGVSPETIGSMDYRAYRQAQYDRLAENLRNSLNMDRIYQIMGLKKGAKHETDTAGAGAPVTD